MMIPKTNTTRREYVTFLQSSIPDNNFTAAAGGGGEDTTTSTRTYWIEQPAQNLISSFFLSFSF
jgi:hypothetical protein